VESMEPLAVFLRAAGAFFQAVHEEIDYTDWNGAIVGRGPGSVIREGIPPSPALSFSELEPLLEMGPFARELVARHPSTPPEVLTVLAGYQELSVQRAVLERPDRDLSAELRLATGFGEIRESLARDPALSPEALEVLVREGTQMAKIYLLERSDVSEATLAALAADPDPAVRSRTVAHPRTTLEWLERAAGDPVEFVRRAAAGNVSTPARLLARIAAQPMNQDTRAVLGKNPATPAAVIECLFEEARGDVRIRSAIAARASLPEELVRACAADTDSSVRVSLASSGTEAATLARMVDDEDVAVRTALARNPRCTALADLATDPDATVRESVAKRADASVEVLEALARDAEPNIRVAVAQSPATPEALRTRLASDRNSRVRAAAEAGPVATPTPSSRR